MDHPVMKVDDAGQAGARGRVLVLRGLTLLLLMRTVGQDHVSPRSEGDQPVDEFLI
jgi:hypothetical protein